MKILLTTHDLIPQNMHLMPWRTVCEVTKHLRDLGHDITLISLGSVKKKIDGGIIPDETFEIRKKEFFLQQDLSEIVHAKNPDVIYWPISWREPRRRTKIVSKFNIPTVGYFPGGCYTLRSALYAVKRIGVRSAFPYLCDALALRARQISCFKQNGFARMIAITDMTAQWMIRAGWEKDRVVVIPPGVEKKYSDNTSNNLPDYISNWLTGRPFFLFMGPPNKIRGTHELLFAFEKVAAKNKEICLVCLFREDDTLDTKTISNQMAQLRYKNRILAIWQSLPKDQLTASLRYCRALMQPFVLIPSEIPLAIIESMALGTPVIISNTEGSGRFAEPFGLVCRAGDIKRLAKAMTALLENNGLLATKKKAAIDLYARHPSWREVAQRWLAVGESLTKG